MDNNTDKKRMDHAEYPRRCRSMTNEQLRYTAQDAHQAAEALPDGINAGYYWDEVHYCRAELRRRGN